MHRLHILFLCDKPERPEAEKRLRRSSMKYQVQENCLTIYLPCEVDDHNADERR